MTRHSVCRARDSRQLDFFSFSPVVGPVDRSPPPEPQALPLRVVPAPVMPVIELPENRFESEPLPPAATALSKASRFTFTIGARPMPRPPRPTPKSLQGQNQTPERTKLPKALVKRDEGQARRHREACEIGVLPELWRVGKTLRQSAELLLQGGRLRFQREAGVTE